MKGLIVCVILCCALKYSILETAGEPILEILRCIIFILFLNKTNQAKKGPNFL